MDGFARSTGLEGTSPQRRYLWTDAFAVCNFLGLAGVTGESRYRDLALQLVDRVHGTLGRHRRDDPRSGWISGLDEVEGRDHPTMGGLRIGKPSPERGQGEPADPEAEWDRDGQYYHYLTKWMHALLRVWQETGDPTYHRWATELAAFSQRAFETPDGSRLYWKISIDGSRPQVPSSGLHDPLDGLLTLASLMEDRPETASSLTEALEKAMRDLSRMCQGGSWRTQDPLGAGSLLVDLYRGARLGSRVPLVDGLLPRVLRDAIDSLRLAVAHGGWRQPASRRIAFREIGLAIGLRSADRLIGPGRDELGSSGLDVAAVLDPLIPTLRPLAEEIERFWMTPEHREADGWSAHRDISIVMLATSLHPAGFLGPG